MIERPRRLAPWADLAIVLVAVGLAFAAVSWADREFLLAEPPSREPPPQVSTRPAWLLEWNHPYRRMQHDAVWVFGAATVGIGAVIARDGRTRRRGGLSGPGTMVVLVTLLVGGVAVANQLLAERPNVSPPAGLSHYLGNVLQYRLPGAILGAWVVGWLGSRRRTRPDWRERLARAVGWLWMATVGLLVGHAILFG